MRNKLSMTGERIRLHVNSLEYIKQMELWDNRFITAALANQDTTVRFNNEENYLVDMQLYAELSGLYVGEAYEKALLASTRLRNTMLDIDLSNGVRHCTSLIFEFTPDCNNKSILINWNKCFIPLLSGRMLAGKFISPLIAASNFSSNKKYLLYLMLEKYLHVLVTNKSFVITKEEIRESLNLPATEYSEFKALNAKIVKPTLLDMRNKLGINIVGKVKGDRMIFTYGEIK